MRVQQELAVALVAQCARDIALSARSLCYTRICENVRIRSFTQRANLKFFVELWKSATQILLMQIQQDYSN